MNPKTYKTPHEIVALMGPAEIRSVIAQCLFIAQEDSRALGTHHTGRRLAEALDSWKAVVKKYST